MQQTLRIIDSGVEEGRLNIALGQAIIEAHQAGTAPDTLRYLRFPPTALVGRHQALEQEINLDYCSQKGIGVVRRITGGGAIYLDPGQLGWELVLRRSTVNIASLADIAREICEAIAEGISSLGVEARYRPRNDIEVDGRKISGTGGFFDGDTLFYQGTVLVDMNPEHMISALKVPQSKLARRNLDSAAQRVVTLRELLGESTPDLPAIQQALANAVSKRFNLKEVVSEVSPEEEKRAQALYQDEIGCDEFVREIDEPPAARGDLAGTHQSPGGTIKSYVRLEGPAQNRIRAVLFTGDFFVAPPRVIYDLESGLRGVYLDQLDETVQAFFRSARIEMLSISADDVITSIRNALESSHEKATKPAAQEVSP